MENKIKVVQVSKDKYFNGVEYIGYQLVDSDVYEFMEGEHLFSHSFIKDSYRKIMGKTLTIIDASIVDKQHNKAVKDLLRQIFNEELCFSSDWGYDQEAIQKHLPNDIAEMDGSEALSVEDVLGVK